MKFLKRRQIEKSNRDILIMENQQNSKREHEPVSELRFDPVSEDWVVIATGRAKKPGDFLPDKKQEDKKPEGGKTCFFCDLSSQLPPKLLIGGEEDWRVAVIPNKFPAFSHNSDQSDLSQEESGPYRRMDGVGIHEVVITREHNRQLALMDQNEIAELISVYQQRYLALMNEKFINYVSIFHNHGQGAGATVAHPHSQILAIPVIDPDLEGSLKGSARYFLKHQRCVHCDMLKEDLRDGRRIIFENEKFVGLCPYASRVAFEVRIYPKKHQSYFEKLEEDDKRQFAEALQAVMKMVYSGLNDPAYNFFIHTSPCDGQDYDHYHWHFECLPKTSIWAGFELSTGIEISTIEPEAAAAYLVSLKDGLEKI